LQLFARKHRFFRLTPARRRTKMRAPSGALAPAGFLS
jgi:hypothetical protein